MHYTYTGLIVKSSASDATSLPCLADATHAHPRYPLLAATRTTLQERRHDAPHWTHVLGAAVSLPARALAVHSG
jgi:hypothetical protein